MADSGIKTVLEGDAAKLFQEFSKVIAKAKELEGGYEKVGRASRGASKHSEELAKKTEEAIGTKALKMADSMIGALGAPLGVAGAVYAVRGEYTAWIRDIERAGEVSEEFYRKLIADLTRTGELLKGQEIEQFLGTLPGVKREDARKTYAGVTGAAPAVGLQKRKEIVKAIAPLAVTGIDVGELGKLGGELAEIAPGKKPEEIADLALRLTQVAGKEAGELTSSKKYLGYARASVARGKDLEEVLAGGILARQAGLPAEDFAKLPAAERGRLGEVSLDLKEAQRTHISGTVREAMKKMPGAAEQLELYGQQVGLEQSPEELELAYEAGAKKRYEERIKRENAASGWMGRAFGAVSRLPAEASVGLLGGYEGKGRWESLTYMTAGHDQEAVKTEAVLHELHRVNLSMLEELKRLNHRRPVTQTD